VLPTIRRGGAANSLYDFDTLAAPTGPAGSGQGLDGFFVPATDERPNPGKSLASTVTSANKRFKDEGRKFTVRSVEHEGQKGAMVYRVA
jgi:hypothetical protein